MKKSADSIGNTTNAGEVSLKVNPTIFFSVLGIYLPLLKNDLPSGQQTTTSSTCYVISRFHTRLHFLLQSLFRKSFCFIFKVLPLLFLFPIWKLPLGFACLLVNIEIAPMIPKSQERKQGFTLSSPYRHNKMVLSRDSTVLSQEEPLAVELLF